MPTHPFRSAELTFGRPQMLTVSNEAVPPPCDCERPKTSFAFSLARAPPALCLVLEHFGLDLPVTDSPSPAEAVTLVPLQQKHLEEGLCASCSLSLP